MSSSANAALTGNKKGLLVTGPPGTGKSVSVYGWLLSVALKKDSPQNCLYVHFAEGKYNVLKVVNKVSSRIHPPA